MAHPQLSSQIQNVCSCQQTVVSSAPSFFHTKIIFLFDSVRVGFGCKFCGIDQNLIRKYAQKCSKHKIQNEEEINREAHACWPNIIWMAAQQKIVCKKKREMRKTTYGWKQRDGKKREFIGRKKKNHTLARREQNTFSQTNQVRIWKCECLMNWKKLRIQFTFEFILHSFWFDLKLCANPMNGIHLYWDCECAGQSYWSWYLWGVSVFFGKNVKWFSPHLLTFFSSFLFLSKWLAYCLTEINPDDICDYKIIF